ncbi:MAG: lytic transglycosylase domain-containing protein [Chloroflexi bacterium]|nr:lytic transglycosylase domain-containing protein [Chloroflexota bacterium]
MTRRSKQLLKRQFRIIRDQLLRLLRLCRRQLRRGPLLIKRNQVFYIPLWLPVVLALALATVPFWDDVAGLAERGIILIQRGNQGQLATFFAPSVQHWSGKINDWAYQYGVDRDLLATVMQIESCGHPTVVSGAGARGLFQVMPFHFSADEDMLDPDTNARRGATFLNYCFGASDSVIGLALACYNGGPGAIRQPRERWSRETQNYYRWGVGIYSDAAAGSARSETLDLWLEAGGSRLCQSARRELAK